MVSVGILFLLSRTRTIIRCYRRYSDLRGTNPKTGEYAAYVRVEENCIYFRRRTYVFRKRSKTANSRGLISVTIVDFGFIFTDFIREFRSFRVALLQYVRNTYVFWNVSATFYVSIIFTETIEAVRVCAANSLQLVLVQNVQFYRAHTQRDLIDLY